MPLSEYERRILGELEDELEQDSPRLARLMRASPRIHRSMDGVLVACALLPGLGFLVLAALVGSSALLAMSALLMCIGFYGTRLWSREQRRD